MGKDFFLQIQNKREKRYAEKNFLLWTLILLTLFITGCNNEKGNNLYIGAEGNYNEELNLTLLNNLYIGLFEYDANNKVTPVL